MTIEVQGYRWSQFLQRLFLARGGAGGAGQTVLDDILPVIELGDSSDAENHRLRGEDLFSVPPVTSGVVAAQFNWAAINNPPGSGKLVVVENLLAVAGLAASCAVMSRNGALVGAGTGILNSALDLRTEVLPALAQCFPVPGYEIGSNGALGTPSWRVIQFVQVAVGWANVGLPTVILPPGSQLGVWHPTVANSVSIQANGYVRDVEPLELL